MKQINHISEVMKQKHVRVVSCRFILRRSNVTISPCRQVLSIYFYLTSMGSQTFHHLIYNPCIIWIGWYQSNVMSVGFGLVFDIFAYDYCYGVSAKCQLYSRWSALLVEETGVPEKYHQSVASHRQT